MLKVLRHKGTQKNIYIFLAVTVILSFVVSGVLISHDDKKTSGALGTIGKRPVSVQQYLDSYRAVQRQAAFIYGDRVNEMKARINFKGEAWDRLLLLDYARRHNISASDAEVVAWVAAQPAFQNKGRFDDKLYALYVERALRSTPRAFEEEIRQMLTIGKVQDSVKSASTLGDDKLKELFQQEKTEKDLLYAMLPWESQQDKVPVMDKDIEQLYGIVKDKLSTPPQVKVSYLFTPKGRTPGTDWKETGYFSKNDAVPEFVNAPEALARSFELAAGEESGPIETAEGNYKIKLVDKKPEHWMSLEESREELKKLFSRQKATNLAVQKLASLKEKMKGTDFEPVLKAEGLEVVSLPKYHAGTYPAGIYPSESLQKAVSELKENGVSDAFEIPKGAMIVKVVKIYPLDEKRFEQEKEAFKKDRSGKQLNDAMNELLEKLRKELSLNLELMKEIFPGEAGS